MTPKWDPKTTPKWPSKMIQKTHFSEPKSALESTSKSTQIRDQKMIRKWSEKCPKKWFKNGSKKCPKMIQKMI